MRKRLKYIILNKKLKSYNLYSKKIKNILKFKY